MRPALVVVLALAVAAPLPADDPPNKTATSRDAVSTRIQRDDAPRQRHAS